MKGQKAIAQDLYNAIEGSFPFEDEGWNQWFAAYHAVEFDANGDWDEWADGVISELAKIARSVTPALDAFAVSTKGV
jgi:hypothetical protein